MLCSQISGSLISRVLSSVTVLALSECEQGSQNINVLQSAHGPSGLW